MERGAGRDTREDPLAFPTAIWIVDPAVNPFPVVAHWIGHSEGHELAVHQSQQRFRLVPGGHGHVLAQAEHVELVHEVVVGRVGAG